MKVYVENNSENPQKSFSHPIVGDRQSWVKVRLDLENKKLAINEIKTDRKRSIVSDVEVNIERQFYHHRYDQDC